GRGAAPRGELRRPDARRHRALRARRRARGLRRPRSCSRRGRRRAPRARLAVSGRRLRRAIRGARQAPRATPLEELPSLEARAAALAKGAAALIGIVRAGDANDGHGLVLELRLERPTEPVEDE